MERKRYLDAAKGWGILMVMFGHISPLSTPVDHYLDSYKVAIFLVVSGYAMALAGSIRKYSWWEFAKKHFRTLMVPYLGVSLLLLPYSAWVDWRGGRTGRQILERLVGMVYKTVSLRGYSSLWFLPCLFVAQLLFFAAMKKGWWARIPLLVASLLCGYFTHPLCKWLGTKFLSFPALALGKAVFSCFFIFAGYGAYEWVGRGRKTPRGVLGIGLTVLNLTAVAASSMPGINYNEMKFKGFLPLVLICGVIGSLGALWVLESLEALFKKKRGSAKRIGSLGKGFGKLQKGASKVGKRGGEYVFRILTWTGKSSLFILVTHVAFNLKYLAYLGYDALFHVPGKAGAIYYLDIVLILGLTLLWERGLLAVWEAWKREKS